MGKGLTSTDGAAYIIKAMSERRVVTHLVLGHNPLGDDGCEALFTWLCSPAGSHYSIQTIYLNVCNIGDRGLLAICRYMKVHSQLKGLWLPGNHFSGDANVVASFVDALNISRLELLALSNTRPDFVSSLFQQLDAPFLRELHCSMCDLQRVHAPALASYITSPRCRLNAFKANANSIGLRAVCDLVVGIERANFSLVSLDLYMNGSAEDDTPEDILAKEDTFKLLKTLLTRNALLKSATETEALALLHSSRSLLLSSWKSRDTHSSSDPRLTFGDLPTEIQLHILSFLAPTLSPQQRIRIYNYASDPATLPELLPTLGQPCLPDPMNLQFASAQGCSDGTCMGSTSSVWCSRGEERSAWLAFVGCDRYEPDSIDLGR